MAPCCTNSVRMLSSVSAIRSPPWQRKRLQVREALHRFLNALLVTKPRILDAAEWRQLDPVSRHFPHIHRAHAQFVDEACDRFRAICAHAGRQTEARPVA